MIAHKPASQVQTRTVSSLYIFMGLAAILVVLAVALAGAVVPASNISGASTNQFKTYTNSGYGYSIAYPTNWQVVDQGNYGVFTAASAMISNDERGGTNFSRQQALGTSPTPIPFANFNKVDVVAYDLDSELSVRDFLLAKSSAAPEGYVTNLQVAGREALKVEVQPGQILENHQDNTTYISVFVTSGKRGYIIAGFAPAPVFERILNSFQIL